MALRKRPCVRYRLSVEPRPSLSLRAHVGRGPGLTPLGDDILIGFLAGRALRGAALPVPAGRTSSLSRTLLDFAALGRLPEPAHELLRDGELEPLLEFGATSGKGIALGHSLASRDQPALPPLQSATIALPLGGETIRCTLTVSADRQAGS